MTARVVSLSLLAGLAVCLAPARLPAPPLPAGTTTGLTTLEKYLTEDVTLVGVTNVKTIAAAPLHTKLKKEVAALADHEFFAKFLKPFGVKPLADVERVVLVMGVPKVTQRNFDGGRQENEDRMYFLFQGKFDPKKFEAGFAQMAKDYPKEAKVVGKGETALLELGNGNSFLALVDRSTFVIAPSKKLVEEVQGRASGKVKAKFKTKDFPAALKELKAESAIDAVGFGGMQVDSKFESLGKGYKLTPITLEEKGFKKLVVRVEVKDDLAGAVTLEGKDKATVGDLAKKMSRGLEEEIERGGKFAERDPVMKAMHAVMKGVKVKTDKQSVVLEGKLDQATAKALLEGMKKMLDEIGQPRGGFDGKK